MSSAPILFDRTLLRKRRARAAANFAAHDFLLREMAARLVDSLDTMAYEFPVMVELGCHSGQLQLGDRRATTHHIRCDLSPAMLQRTSGMRVAVDEEWLPFAENSVDAVVSVGALHWVNDLPGTLAQIQRILKPDGLFMAMLPGAETLRELRQVCAQTDAARMGGITPRVSPFIDIRDAGALLQRAGFALPVADTDTVRVEYENLFALMRDLRGGAQQNMLQGRVQHFTPRGWFMDAAARYAEQFSTAEKRIIASVELITMTAWKPSANQQQPARRGSGKISFLDGLG
jgi:SAM-dependent methyltransferase